MPPKKGKDEPSKKAQREKKAQRIDDLTFGLKNKNKSAKMRLFIDRAEKQVKHSFGDHEAAAAKAAKKDAKMAKLLQEEELRVLVNEGIANQAGKKKAQSRAEAEKLGLTEQKKEVVELLETLSSDDEDDEDDKDDGVIYLPDEEVAVEVFREKTIEDIIEEQRAKLSAEGKVGTPVTEETFRIWRAKKLEKRKAEVRPCVGRTPVLHWITPAALVLSCPDTALVFAPWHLCGGRRKHG
jgi:hypothetical protein